MQVDDGVSWDQQTNSVISIDGQPIEMDRNYSVALNGYVLQGVDELLPLLEFIKNQPNDFLHSSSRFEVGKIIDVGIILSTAMELRNILVAFYSKLTLFDLLNETDFCPLDHDQDGFLNINELELMSVKTNESLSIRLCSLVCCNILSVASKNRHDRISKTDAFLIFIIVNSFQFPLFGNDVKFTIDDFELLAKKCLGTAFEKAIALEVFSQFRGSHTGHILLKDIAMLILVRPEIDFLMI